MPSRNADTRHVTDETHDPRDRYSLYRLCDCSRCEGRGKAPSLTGSPELMHSEKVRCPDCRGEGKVRQELATAATPEAVGVALVTLAREGEWADCPLGLLDRTPECERCEGRGNAPRVTDRPVYHGEHITCPDCKGSGVKPTGTWLILPWQPSPRNVRDAARTLAQSKSRPRPDFDPRTDYPERFTDGPI